MIFTIYTYLKKKVKSLSSYFINCLDNSYSDNSYSEEYEKFINRSDSYIINIPSPPPLPPPPLPSPKTAPKTAFKIFSKYNIYNKKKTIKKNNKIVPLIQLDDFIIV